jgi:hypothetical protein
MNVIVDSGNTYSKIGWFQEEKLIRYTTRLSFDELIQSIRSEIPQNIIYSSVSRTGEEFRKRSICRSESSILRRILHCPSGKIMIRLRHWVQTVSPLASGPISYIPVKISWLLTWVPALHTT